ncbi:DUF1254 domain-containing protein [Streptomyces anulatus]|uniref:DUF1254 domain-containing protein n=1 Tax=Streptomyces anulatus TaxID=1892 RepID=UPI0034053C9E
MSDASDKALHGRAFEAVVWGMSAVNFRLMYDAGISAGMTGSNQIVWWPGLMDHRNQTLTPNPDVIYLMPFYDTSDGPVVLEIPPAHGGTINGTVMNYWQAPIEDVGPAGLDAGSGAKYLILPPGYADPVPENYIPLASDTYQGYALLRSIPADQNPASIETAVAYAQQIAFYPYTPGGETGKTLWVSALEQEFNSAIRWDTSFFTTLNTMVQAEPFLERDRVMIDQLATLGIVRGTPFAPDEATKTVLDTAIRDAKEWLNEGYEAYFDAPYWPDTGWAIPTVPTLTTNSTAGFALRGSYPVDARGVSFTFEFFYPRHLGKGQAYLVAITDTARTALDGAQNYRLTVPADAPVSQYWSLTAYNRDTHTLLPTDILSRSSLNPDLVTNPDGTVDIYCGPEAPKDGPAANWIPTVAGSGFEVMLRLYGPQQAFTDKTWALPDIQRL